MTVRLPAWSALAVPLVAVLILAMLLLPLIPGLLTLGWWRRRQAAEPSP